MANPEDRLKVIKRPQKPGKEDLEKLKNTPIPTRRVKLLMVNPTDFMYMFTKGLKWRKNWSIIEGVPEDAKVIAITPDSIRNGIMLVVESDSYDEIPINVLPPAEPVSIDMTNRPQKKIPKRKKKK